MGKIYNIVFNSGNGSGAPNAKTFYYDWGQLPEGKYKCKFSYIGGGATLTSINNAKVYLDLGQNKQYEPQASFQSSTPTVGRFIGCLFNQLVLPPMCAIGTGSITGTVLTITAMSTGPFNNRMYITSDTAGITGGTFITSMSGTTYGGAGTYNLNTSSTLPSSQIYGTNLPSYTLFADTTTNPPFYLENRPFNNSFTLNILSLLNASWVDTLGSAPSSYVLTLYMELLD